MFSVPDHDAGLAQEALGPVPMAGFFAAGEIGAVGGNTLAEGLEALSVKALRVNAPYSDNTTGTALRWADV